MFLSDLVGQILSEGDTMSPIYHVTPDNIEPSMFEEEPVFSANDDTADQR